MEVEGLTWSVVTSFFIDILLFLKSKFVIEFVRQTIGDTSLLISFVMIPFLVITPSSSDVRSIIDLSLPSILSSSSCRNNYL